MNIGFWSCIILVIPFVIIGVLFAIFKEKATKFVSGFNSFSKEEQAMYDKAQISRDIRNQCFIWTVIMLAGATLSCFLTPYMAIRIVSLIIIYEVLKNFKYKIKANDCAVLSTVFMIGFAALMFSVYNVLNLSKIPHILIFFSLTIFILIFLIVFLYSKNTMFLREQEQKDKMQIAQLQQQFAYYQEKLKDEEKVRSVYHDMKNHLLVLQRQINSPETAEMVEKLQSQVAMYEDYEHTGNDILDIILKEKSETAREKHIALSVTADLNGVDFIEPLDVSTIFGNGLDNAIEASEKLPEEQRAILVKAGRVQNFFSVLIENSCLQNREYTKQRTTKSDDFLHGFGISNMRKAAEKYDGQLTIKCENEKFTLKILIPIP